MRTRPRGVAHVSIMWFIIMCVFFLGGVGFGYIHMQKAADLTLQLQKARADKDKETARADDNYLKHLELSKPVGFRPDTPDSLSSPDLIRQKVQDLKPLCDAGASDTTLQAILPKMEGKIVSLKQRVEELQTSLSAAEAGREEARRTLNSTVSEKDTTIAQLRTEKTDIDANLRTQLDAKEAANADLRSTVRTKNEELAKAKESWEAEKKEFLGKVTELTVRNERVRDKLAIIEDPDKIDGTVISTSEALQRAWINLGRKHMVKPGMTFEVLELRGNQHVHKAWATVLTVEQESSEVAIADLVDRFNPVAKGNGVKNQLYDPEVRFNFVLLGRFVEPLTKGDITRILTNMGNSVADEVTPDTDFLVLGREPLGEEATKLEQTEDYAKALRMSVNIVPIKKIQSFLKL